MAQLANNKVPRLNSQGEKYRERQLMLQLPRQVTRCSLGESITDVL